MGNQQDEVDRRTAVARTAIREAIADESVRLFVEHHLEELKSAYWKKHAGTPKPTPQQIIELLVLKSHWGDEDEDGLDHFDFTLPGDVTDCLLTVEFGANGAVEGVDMES